MTKNASVANAIGQVLHLASLHHQLPDASHVPGVKFSLTRRFLKLSRHQNVMSDGDKKALYSLSEA